MEDVVYGALRRRGGSISAEHGIGLQKLDVNKLVESAAVQEEVKSEAAVAPAPESGGGETR